VGDQLFAVVLSWVAVQRFGAAAGWLTALGPAATLVTALLAGHWADRRSYLQVMIGADLARACVLGLTVAAWLAAGAPPTWTLVACVIVLAAGVAFFRPAMQASLPALVRDPALLPATNALLDTTERIARLLGPGVVSMASALIPLVHFVTLDAASFVVSAAAVALVARARPVDAAPPSRALRGLEAIARGFRTVRRHKLLGFVLAVTGVINGGWSAAYFLGLPLLIERAGVRGPGGSGLAAYGLVISAYGSTNLLATLIIGNRPIGTRPGRMVFGGNLALGGGIVAMGVAALILPSAWLLPCFMAAAAVSAIGGPMQDIVVATLRQTDLPRQDLPAAVRAFIVSSQGGALVALALAPLLFRMAGAASGVMLCGAAIVAVAVAGLIRDG
jgi:hypothetical protein